MDSFISIIIPVYNTGEKLKVCVNSLLTQTFYDYEVVLVDDGSTDGITPKLCDDIAASDSRFSVLHYPNGGVAIARNRGFEASSCEYVVFIDGDDKLYSNDVLQSIHDLIYKYPNIDIIKGGYQRIESSTKKTIHQTDKDRPFYRVEDFLYSNLKAKCGGFTWNTVYRRSVMMAYNLRMEEASMEDHIFFLKYLQYVKCAFLTKTIFYNYYDNQGSVSYSSKFSAFDILDEALYERQLYLTIFSETDKKCMYLINEGLSSNINRALFNLYHFEKSQRKRKMFVEKVKYINGFVPSLKCLTFPMPFILRDLLLRKKYGR